MSEAREERLARNEILFRSVNENIRGVAANLGDDVGYEFICECSTSDCFDRLALTLAEYERVRAEGSHFLLAPGHEDIEVEQVIEVRPGYVVVAKDGVAGVMADAEDPRA